MTAAEELYYKYGGKTPIPNNADEAFIITEYHFRKAIEGHDSEIKEKIREMITSISKTVKDFLWEKDITDEYDEKILKAIGEARIAALTELKQFIEGIK